MNSAGSERRNMRSFISRTNQTCAQSTGKKSTKKYKSKSTELIIRRLIKRSRTANVLFLLGLYFSALVTPAFSEDISTEIKSSEEQTENSKADDKKTETDIPAIVITPSRFPQALDKVGSSISIITGEELEARKEPNLLEALRNVEGLQVNQSGGLGRTTSVFLRGAGANQTLVLVDGIPVNEVNSGLFDFADLTTLGIERVEIIRGPQSVMYGADAMGGVINIITSKIDSEPKTSFGFETGTYNTQRYISKVSGGTDTVRGSAAFSYLNSDNISVANRDRGNPENDPYDNMSVVGSVEADLPQEVAIKTNLRYTRARTSLDTFDFERGFVDALDFAQRRDTLQSSTNISREFTNWTPSLLLGYNFDEFEGRDGENVFNNYEFTSSTLSVQQQNLIRFTDEMTGLGGYSYRRSDGENIGSFNERREINSLFYEQQYSPLESTTLGAGIRYDHDSTFGDETTYRFNIAHLLPELNSKLRASYGTGFRAPTFNDLFFPGFSNPDLSPERSRGFDVGVTSSFFGLQSDVTYFETNYKNLINFNTETFTPENISCAKVKGIETRLALKEFEWIEPYVTYTYLDSENNETGASLARRAKHQGGMGFAFIPIEKLKLNTNAFYIASRKDSGGAKMDDYFIVSGTAQYEVYDGIEPYIRVQNLFDRDYEEIPGYGTPGASVFVGFEVRL